MTYYNLFTYNQLSKDLAGLHLIRREIFNLVKIKGKR